MVTERTDKLVDHGIRHTDSRHVIGATWGSHVPVLRAIARAYRVETVVEYGCGLFSTLLFLDPSEFRHLRTLVSLETDREWLRWMTTVIRDDRWVPKVASSSDIRRPSISEPIDLLFSDGANGELRELFISRTRDRVRVAVLHDAQKYRVSGFRYTITFKGTWIGYEIPCQPFTAVYSDQEDVTTLENIVDYSESDYTEWAPWPGKLRNKAYYEWLRKAIKRRYQRIRNQGRS